MLDSVEDDFVRECSFAFDAAYVLNPAFYDAICDLAASREPEDMLEWNDLRQGTLDILDILVKRDAFVRKKGEEYLLNEQKTVKTEF